MKKLVIAGVLGLAAVSAYFIYSSQNQPEQQIVFEPEISTSEVKAQVLETIPDRAVKRSEAESALARLGLLEPSDTVTWDARYGDNGSYEFTNLSLVDDDQTITAANFEISGLRLIEEEQIYFDAISADNVLTVSGNETLNISALGMKMPEIDEAVTFVPMPSGTDAGSIAIYFGEMIQPGVLPELPEVYVENVKMTESRKISALNLDIYDPAQSTINKPEPITVEDITTLDFATLLKANDGTGYAFTANGYKQIGHNYMGEMGTTELMSLNLSGFDSDILVDFENSFGMAAFGQVQPPNTEAFKPLFLSMSAQGFKYENDVDIIRVDQATVRHSDTRADQFTRRIDVPRISLNTKSYLQDDEDSKHSENPFKEFGYDNIDLSYSSQTSFDRSRNSIHEDATRLTASNAFDIVLSYKLRNVESVSDLMRRRFMAIPDSPESSPMIELGSLEITDRGIIDRVSQTMADDQELTVEEVKKSAINLFSISKNMAETDYQKEVIQEAVDAYGGWINYGGNLRVSVSPQRPMNFEELGEITNAFLKSPFPTPEPEAGFSTDDFTAELKRDAADNLLRELNVRFEHN